MNAGGHIPPEEVAEAAAKGLDLRQKFHRGGTQIGVARARDLKNRVHLSDETLKRMKSYFKRHAVDKRAKNFGNDDDPSAGYVAWLLWGGRLSIQDAGFIGFMAGLIVLPTAVFNQAGPRLIVADYLATL